MEVLFEYRGSRRQLTASSGQNVVDCVSAELRRLGRSNAQVYTANTDLNTLVGRSDEVYLLQKWSPQWECYVDVNQPGEISDGDKLAVVMKPRPPSKLLLLCCWCSGVDQEPQVQGVPRNKKSAVRKNEEIQSLDFVFNVESARNSHVSEWEESQSIALSESKETDLYEGEQYIRADSGRASWKLVPMKSSESSEDMLSGDAQQTEDLNITEHSIEEGHMEMSTSPEPPMEHTLCDNEQEIRQPSEKQISPEDDDKFKGAEQNEVIINEGQSGIDVQEVCTDESSKPLGERSMLISDRGAEDQPTQVSSEANELNDGNDAMAVSEDDPLQPEPPSQARDEN